MRADRLVSIILLLQTHRQLTAKELSRRLEVSERTILRDMDSLSGSGVPVVAERGTGGGWRLMDGYQTKLTGINTAEAQALFLARPSKLLADLGLRQEAESAMLKLQAALPTATQQRAAFTRDRILVDSRGWRDPAESVGCLPVLLDALWNDRKLRFIYAGALSAASERVVDPLGLVAKGSTWYLVAEAHDQTRTYRVSRMQDAEILASRATRPEDFDLAHYWSQSAADFREKLPRFHATFLAKPGVMRWIRYRGWRVEEEVLEGDLYRVRLRFDVEAEAIQFALSYGGDVEAIEPRQLRDRVHAAALQVAARHL